MVSTIGSVSKKSCWKTESVQANYKSGTLSPAAERNALEDSSARPPASSNNFLNKTSRGIDLAQKLVIKPKHLQFSAGKGLTRSQSLRETLTSPTFRNIRSQDRSAMEALLALDNTDRKVTELEKDFSVHRFFNPIECSKQTEINNEHPTKSSFEGKKLPLDLLNTEFKSALIDINDPCFNAFCKKLLSVNQPETVLQLLDKAFNYNNQLPFTRHKINANHALYFFKAALLIQTQNYSEAQSTLEHAKKTMPMSNAADDYLIGRLLEKQGHYWDAIDTYENALKADKPLSAIGEALKSLLCAKGQINRAYEVNTKVLSDQNNCYLIEHMDDLLKNAWRNELPTLAFPKTQPMPLGQESVKSVEQKVALNKKLELKLSTEDAFSLETFSNLMHEDNSLYYPIASVKWRKGESSGVSFYSAYGMVRWIESKTQAHGNKKLQLLKDPNTNLPIEKLNLYFIDRESGKIKLMCSDQPNDPLKHSSIYQLLAQCTDDSTYLGIPECDPRKNEVLKHSAQLAMALHSLCVHQFQKQRAESDQPMLPSKALFSQEESHRIFNHVFQCLKLKTSPILPLLAMRRLLNTAKLMLSNIDNNPLSTSELKAVINTVMKSLEDQDVNSSLESHKA